MKTILPLLALTCLALSLAAQEPLPREEAVKFAALLNFDLDKLADTPIPTDADVKRPFGLKADKHGGLVVPEARLSLATLNALGKQVAPVGQLWLAGLVPAKEGQPLARDQFKLVTVQYEGREVTLPLFLLGVRKGSGDKLELLLFGKSKEPLLTLPLTPVSREQKWPLELRAEREGDLAARVTLELLGKYEASFPLKVQAE